MSVRVRERETNERGEGDHNILFLTYYIINLTFPTATLLSQHKDKEVGIKTWRQWGKREKGRRRGELRQPGSVGWSENMTQNGYHLIPQHLRSTTHNISYCKRHTDARGGVTFLVGHSHNEGIHIYIRIISTAPCVFVVLAHPEPQSRPSFPIFVHCALHRDRSVSITPKSSF